MSNNFGRLAYVFVPLSNFPSIEIVGCGTVFHVGFRKGMVITYHLSN